MKKIIILIMFYFVFIPNVYSNSAFSYIVMDMDTKNVLWGRNINETRLIASTSKIMTTIIALENASLDDVIKADKSILKAVGSSIYIEVGEYITLKDLLYGLMLRSGNDAAILIANHISGNMANFSTLMNKYAEKIGMNNTVFYNSHGLEESSGIGNTSTSYDMALLTTYAMKNKEFRKIFRTKNYQAKSNVKTYSWQNKNKLLKYDFITGGKTGFTQKARRTLVTTASINNMNIVVVTLNDPNDWKDHLEIYNNITNNYQKIKALDKKNFKIIDDNVYIEDKLFIKNDYQFTIKKNNIKNISIKYILKQNSKYNNNQKIGYAKIFFNNEIIHIEPIYVKKQKKSNIKKFFMNLFK